MGLGYNANSGYTVIATHSDGLSGQEILEVNDEFVTYRNVSLTGVPESKVHRVKVHSDCRRAYFMANGRRVFFDECLSTGVGRY